MEIIKSLYDTIVDFVNTDEFKKFKKFIMSVAKVAAVIIYVVCSVTFSLAKRSKR